MTGTILGDLVSHPPSVLNYVENKYERSRSHKRQKMESKPIFNSTKGRSDFSTSFFSKYQCKGFFLWPTG